MLITHLKWLFWFPAYLADTARQSPHSHSSNSRNLAAQCYSGDCNSDQSISEMCYSATKCRWRRWRASRARVPPGHGKRRRHTRRRPWPPRPRSPRWSADLQECRCWSNHWGSQSHCWCCRTYRLCYWSFDCNKNLETLVLTSLRYFLPSAWRFLSLGWLLFRLLRVFLLSPLLLLSLLWLSECLECWLCGFQCWWGAAWWPVCQSCWDRTESRTVLWCYLHQDLDVALFGPKGPYMYVHNTVHI